MAHKCIAPTAQITFSLCVLPSCYPDRVKKRKKKSGVPLSQHPATTKLTTYYEIPCALHSSVSLIQRHMVTHTIYKENPVI